MGVGRCSWVWVSVGGCDWVWVGMTGCGWVGKMVKLVNNYFIFFKFCFSLRTSYE